MRKKTAVAIILFSAIVTFAGIDFAGAQYTPLVQIPGVPAGSTNLSLYLVGLYNFLLSVVGIVAVMMLIIGGMRYITAAGNQAAISDAKDIITSALFGLLLAILSWVIVAEINPDVLYLKPPGGSFVDTPSTFMGCGTWDLATSICTCKDGNTLGIIDGAIDQNTCSLVCNALNHCLSKPNMCVKVATPLGSDSLNFMGICKCVDGENIFTGMKPPVDCQKTCLDMKHCLVADAKIGSTQGGTITLVNELERKYCINDTSEQNPLVTNHNIFLMVNADSSISGNPIAWWRWDFDGNTGVWDEVIDATVPANGSRMLVKADYDHYLPFPNCKKTNTPEAITCYILLEVEDDKGNTSRDTVFMRILNYH